MSIKTPLRKEKIKTHFTYGLWKYALLAILAVFGWNMIYTTTSYRPPEDKKVNFYVVSGSASYDVIAPRMKSIHEAIFPDMEEVSVVTLMGGEDPNAVMQLSVYIMAGEGDVYLLPYADFYSYARQGAFMPLDEYAESGALNLRGIDVSAGYQTIDADGEDSLPERHLFGIPTYELNGFIENYWIDSRDMVLCVLYRNGNDENSVKLVDYLIGENLAELPERLQETEQ